MFLAILLVVLVLMAVTGGILFYADLPEATGLAAPEKSNQANALFVWLSAAPEKSNRVERRALN